MNFQIVDFNTIKKCFSLFFSFAPPELETSHVVLLHVGVCSGVGRREQSRVEQRRLGKIGVMEAYAPNLLLPPVLLLFPVCYTTPLPVDGWMQN